MEKAKLDLENQRCYELVHGNKIIVIDDTDSDSDGTEPLGSNKLSITVFNTGVALDSDFNLTCLTIHGWNTMRGSPSNLRWMKIWLLSSQVPL
ncbi:BnaC09g20550D [Brassica napus]|uniref:BnaC09g20550D protein n=1 Tax=Brassica napus TaxID=3708 RepID=A0A078GL96_BRANA|nr:BnaC09g20550D [Brassica napus]